MNQTKEMIAGKRWDPHRVSESGWEDHYLERKNNHSECPDGTAAAFLSSIQRAWFRELLKIRFDTN